MLISIVVPCMNEEESIPYLVERLEKTVEPYGDSAEILLVDDGSTDETWSAIQDARKSCPQLRGLRLSSNRGHQVALTAGLEAAQGERIFMLDADLQDPPELLGDMMGMMDRGYDVVYGSRRKREGETVFKRVTAWAFYRVLNTMSDIDIPRDTGDFRLVNQKALKAVLSMPERARFVRGMFAWAGFNQIGIEYVRAPRELGETKYPLRKMIRFAFDAMTAFSTKPLKLATRMSFASLGFSALMMIYVLHSLIVYQTAPGWASVVLVISLFSGVQLMTLGILGEYIGRLYIEAKNRPLYFVSEDTSSAEILSLRKVVQVVTRTSHISRFALVGASISALYVLLYLAFLQIGMPQGRANALAFMFAITAQYAAQARFTFGKQLADPAQIFRFGVMTGFGFITSALLTGYIAPDLALDNWIAAVAVALILPVQNYILMTLWVFTKSVS